MKSGLTYAFMDSKKKISLRSYLLNTQQMMSLNSEIANRCDYCGRITERVRVHGHEQCAFCGTNVEPCCNGEHYEVDAYR